MATDDKNTEIPEIEATPEEENGAPLEHLQVIPLVALRDTVIFPEMIVPLTVGRDRSVKALDRAVRSSQPVALVTQRSSEQEEISSVDELYTIGTLAKIAQVIRLQDGTIRAIVQGQRRIRLLDLVQTDPHLEARVELIDDASEKTLEIEALMASIHAQIEQYVSSGASVPPEVAVAARNIADGGLLADMTAYSPEMTTEQRQELLETIDVADRLRLASAFLAKQIEVLELKGRIQSEVKSEMDKTQREYILREQMKAIQKELGEDDPAVAEAGELREKVEQSAMPDEVKEKALKEVDRLARIPSASPEQGVIRTYVDWLVSLPWGVETDDNLDLDEDHYGLEKIKERILEYLAVRTLADTIRSPILAFVGPPGVGKTSLGKSIAKAMGRKFVRMTPTSGDAEGMRLIRSISLIARALISSGMPAASTFSRSSLISACCGSSSPSSRWIAFNCSRRMYSRWVLSISDLTSDWILPFSSRISIWLARKLETSLRRSVTSMVSSIS